MHGYALPRAGWPQDGEGVSYGTCVTRFLWPLDKAYEPRLANAGPDPNCQEHKAFGIKNRLGLLAGKVGGNMQNSSVAERVCSSAALPYRMHK